MAAWAGSRGGARGGEMDDGKTGTSAVAGCRVVRWESLASGSQRPAVAVPRPPPHPLPRRESTSAGGTCGSD